MHVGLMRRPASNTNAPHTAALQHELTSQPELQALECHATVHDPAPTFPASPKEGPRAPPCLHINLCPGDASQAPQLLLQVQLDLHSAELQWVVGEVVRTLVAPHELAKVRWRRMDDCCAWCLVGLCVQCSAVRCVVVRVLIDAMHDACTLHLCVQYA